MAAYLGQENTLSVRTSEFVDNELGAIPLIPTAISAGSELVKGGGGLSLVKNLGGKIGSIFGGGKEEGYGRAKAGTLEWYIDKLKDVNDNEAFQIASQIRQMALNGSSQQQIISYLERNSGEKVLGPEEYGPIITALKQEVQEAVNQSQQGTQQGQTTNQNAAVPVAASVASGNGVDPMMLLKIGGTVVVLGGAGYAVWKLTQQ